jgi:hypothetical protein
MDITKLSKGELTAFLIENPQLLD